ncbi:alpha/beta hydrolase [Fulvimarina sp. 2208YS6-2-32]|uniref:Alpha/beta hydrolase n=1 Tax=Fulvimarina uroteuthidis TaxID=3098149 RepID=A0ABU5I001_9HYPH|nr:alpha/beta hydrolase [Fulvimarina sp. 2208YS6-2-32]MDY8108447.1 alpha/beta hydrolase [Fulvimarina sp. 2208YS6-2-32]
MSDHPTPDAFVEIAGNPPPPNLVAKLVTTPDGVELRCAVSAPDGPVRGTILMLQGRNETIEKYFETIGDLNARGYMVATFDWRGQGASAARSPKKREKHRPAPATGRRLGHVRGMRAYRTDLECVVKTLLLPDCRPPFAVLAHSMGGLVALAAAAELSSRVERMVLSAPLVALPESRVPASLVRFVAWGARLVGLGRVPVRRGALPGALGTPADNPLTSDPRRFERNQRLATRYPGLFQSAPTFGWLASMTSAMKRFERSTVIARHSIPTLFICAGGDRVVSTRAAERLAWRMRSGSSLTLPDARHELLQEKDRYREPFLDALETFFGPAMGEVTAETGIDQAPKAPTQDGIAPGMIAPAGLPTATFGADKARQPVDRRDVGSETGTVRTE